MDVEDAVAQALRLPQDPYNNDVLFIEPSLDERSGYDERIRAALNALDAEHDGKRSPSTE